MHKYNLLSYEDTPFVSNNLIYFNKTGDKMNGFHK